MSRILVLLAHPSLAQSRVNRALLQAARELATATASPVAVRDLYALYPDYSIDVAAEQAAAEQAELLVWQHPIHWYGMPPMMKLWLDEVLSFGWAYGPGGTALRDKAVWPVLSTGGPSDSYRPASYNRYPFEAFLPPYDQTAALCGMRMLPPLMLHGAHRVASDALARHVSQYAQALATWPLWADPARDPPCAEVPEDARPQAAAGPWPLPPRAGEAADQSPGH
jgi:glutathione-regulated potassium-efflux system ancillary protein KefF